MGRKPYNLMENACKIHNIYKKKYTKSQKIQAMKGQENTCIHNITVINVTALI